MKTKSTLHSFVSTVFILMVFASCSQKSLNPAENEKKNVLLVMVDDMGYTDIGPYGGEIQTPTLDKLAQNGVLFTDFHTSISCSPTRSMLLSGTDNHLAGLGNMGELLAPNQIGNPGYEGYLNSNVVSLAEVLKGEGYHTYMAGKWHLGHDDYNIPGARGFEKSLSILYGGGSHFADRAGIMPTEDPAAYSKNGEFIDELPKDFFSSRSYTDYLMQSIRENKNDDKPFLAYLAFTAPHDPLHVPEPWLSQYKGTYDKGYEYLREQRINKAKEHNLIPKDAPSPAMHAMVPQWNSLTDEEKALEAKKMEVYAGMVSNMDYHLGRMLNFLEDIDELDNTVVIFLSDNGSNPWVNTQYPGNEDGVYLSKFDNTLENIGNPTSHIAYGIGWASACSGPLDYFKMTVGEGGMRTPFIISGPGIEKGVKHANFAYVTDIMPTILEMLDIKHPETFNGKEVLPMTGKSMAQVLSGEKVSVYNSEEFIAGEMGNGKWVIKGDYKAVKVVEPYSDNQWKLYNIKQDPGETNNIAKTNSKMLNEFVEAWEAYANEVGVVLRE